MPAGEYPVLVERALVPVERRLFRPPWRDPAGLPAQVPGAVYVFEYDGRYQDPYSRRVTGFEPHVLEATAVSQVQLRDRLLTVRRWIPSADSEVSLIVAVTFRCLVTDPVSVAGGGVSDLESVLATHVSADRELGTLGRDVPPDRAADTLLRVEAQVRAHCAVNPPETRGIEAIVAAVEVHAAGPYEAPDGSRYQPEFLGLLAGDDAATADLADRIASAGFARRPEPADRPWGAHHAG